MAPPFGMHGHMTPGPHGMHMQQQHGGPQMSHQPSPYGHHPQFDDHQMRPSASQSSHFPSPSPRMQQPNVAYQSPMPAHAQMAYGHPGQYPVQTPPMGGRQFSNPQQMVPMQGGHLAPMMMQQHSSGGFMHQPIAVPYNPQMQMYPGPGPNQPVFGSPGQPANGFPSPGRGAPMMMHQGSQQGQQPMYVQPGQYPQPVYAQQPPAHSRCFLFLGQNLSPNLVAVNMRPNYGSPQPGFAQHTYPQHHFPQQIHRTPSQGYSQPHHGPPPPQQQQHQQQQQQAQPPQPPQVQQRTSAPQGPPQPAGSKEGTEEGKS